MSEQSSAPDVCDVPRTSTASTATWPRRSPSGAPSATGRGSSSPRRRRSTHTCRSLVTGKEMSLRYLLVDLIAEYARHNGHADLLRERIDGATGA